MAIDEMFKLERDGEGDDMRKSKADAKQQSPAATQDEPQAPFMESSAVTAGNDAQEDASCKNDELQAIRDENAALRAMLENIQQQLRSQAGPVQAAPAGKVSIDKTRPFSKTRTSGGGVTYEQDGRIFNARMELITKATE